MSQNKQYLAAIANKTTVTPKAAPQPATVKPVATPAPQPATVKPVAAPAPQPATVKPVATPAPQPAASEPAQPAATTATQSFDRQKENLYLYGVQMFERRSYQVAYNIFSKIPDYKNANEYLEKLKSLI